MKNEFNIDESGRGRENLVLGQSIIDELSSFWEFHLHNIPQFALVDILELPVRNQNRQVYFLPRLHIAFLVFLHQASQVDLGVFKHLQLLFLELDYPLLLDEVGLDFFKVVDRVCHFVLHAIGPAVSISLFLHRDDVGHLQYIKDIVFSSLDGLTLDETEPLDDAIHEFLIPETFAFLDNLEDKLGEFAHFYFILSTLLIQMPRQFLDCIHPKKAGV